MGACDIAITVDTVAFTEARLGLAPAIISLTTLPRMEPRPAHRWFLTGEAFDAHAAAQAGLVSAAVPAVADERARALDDLAAYEARSLATGPATGGAELLWWWRQGAAEFDLVVAGRDGSVRVPWFGPEMALRSLVSARLMETRAHGQDVADALGVQRNPTDRLRHVAALAVRARRYAFAIRGLEPPGDPVRVELTAPSGAEWVFSPQGTQAIRGTALEFCPVLTRRRHVADTKLVADGPLAREWLEIGQA